MEQRILATIFCGGGHRAWGLTFVDNCDSIFFVCSSSDSQLKTKEIPLNGHHMLLVNYKNNKHIYIFTSCKYIQLTYNFGLFY